MSFRLSFSWSSLIFSSFSLNYRMYSRLHFSIFSPRRLFYLQSLLAVLSNRLLVFFLEISQIFWISPSRLFLASILIISSIFFMQSATSNSCLTVFCSWLPDLSRINSVTWMFCFDSAFFNSGGVRLFCFFSHFMKLEGYLIIELGVRL